MPSPNSVFYGQIAELVVQFFGEEIDATAFQDAMEALLPDWDGSIEDAARKAVEAVQKLNGALDDQFERDSDLSAWAAGVVGGGPGNDGKYPIRIGVTTILLECPAQLKATMAKGDPGLDAKTGVSFTVLGPFNPDDLLDLAVVHGAFILDVPAIVGWAIGAPAANVTLTIRKNDSPWGSVTFSAGSPNSVTASFSSVEVSTGDAIALYAPASPDATFGNFGLTLPGV